MSEMEPTAGSGRVGAVIVLGLGGWVGWGGGGGVFRFQMLFGCLRQYCVFLAWVHK